MQPLSCTHHYYCTIAPLQLCNSKLCVRTVDRCETNRSCPTWGTTAMYRSDGKHHGGACIITGMGEGDCVGCHISGHHSPFPPWTTHYQGKGRELGATYQYRWSELFMYSIYSTVVRSIVKYTTQWTDSLYYVHMCGKCAVDKPSVCDG